MSVIDLARLPPPDVVETIDYEAVLSSMKADLMARAPELAPVLALESEPLVKLLEVAAWREMVLRARINDAARSNLLAFATGGDLDQLAAFYGVARMAGEGDEALRQRVQARLHGWANAGAAAHYRYWAMSASTEVQDVGVMSPAPGVVRIGVLVRAGADVGATLDAVRALVTRDDIKVLTDTIEVVDAAWRVANIVADVWRLPGTPPSLLDERRAAMMAAVPHRLGWDLTRSWIIAQLHVAGIHRVELVQPTADVRSEPFEAVRLGDVVVEDRGVDA